jgi:predicted ATPase with chaperone activity
LLALRSWDGDNPSNNAKLYPLSEDLVEEDLSLKQILAEPQSLEDLKIQQNLVIDLIFRLLYNEGNVALSRFTEVLKIPKSLIDGILLWMQKEHLVEVSKASVELGRLGNVYTLTDAGETRARAAMERSQYVGPVPVSIPAYNSGIELQTRHRIKVSPEQVKRALDHLVLPENFHRLVGPAVNYGTSLFLYGPPGNGKTTIAQAIASMIAHSEPIYLPYAITAGGQFIQIHDRIVHKQIPPEKNRRNDLGRLDLRWGLFERPTVSVGGELKMDSLELRFDPISKFYEAPLQLKANGGMFLIDDFGRQQVSTADLLNRWIVPLESMIDFLRLQTGQTIVVPFRQLTVFSTNLKPRELVDDAFLRRIHMKINVDSPDERLYYQLFTLVAKSLNLPFDKESFIHLLQKWYREPGRKFQAVQPRDLLHILVTLCEYDNQPPHMTPELIDEACRSYFVD